MIAACGMRVSVVMAVRVRMRMSTIVARGSSPDVRSVRSRAGHAPVRVDLARGSILYISGTASIDGEGRVAHPGDPERQARRMLLNVEQLLAGQGAGLGAVVSAVTYLKRAVDADTVRAAARAAGLSDAIPHTLCVADICRPEWLCEIEAIAVLP